MTTEQRQEWLAGLKSGDEVQVLGYGDKRGRIAKVTAKLFYVQVWSEFSFSGAGWSRARQFRRDTGRGGYERLEPTGAAGVAERELLNARRQRVKTLWNRITTDLPDEALAAIEGVLERFQTKEDQV